MSGITEKQKMKEKFICGYGWNSEGFAKAMMLSHELLGIITAGIKREKRFRVELIYDPEKEKNFRMIAAEFAEDDTDEEFHKYFEY